MKKNEDSKHGYIRPQTCRNCGINGHLYKDCIHPIMSFGIICYKINNNKIEYLMIQRKDSLSFMEFIRGKYSINNEEYIEELINNMTENEKELISSGDFDKIKEEIKISEPIDIPQKKPINIYKMMKGFQVQFTLKFFS